MPKVQLIKWAQLHVADTCVEKITKAIDDDDDDENSDKNSDRDERNEEDKSSDLEDYL